MKKVISFSLYGTNEVYQQGAIANALMAKTFYPDWECWFYYNNASIPSTVISDLNSIKNVKTISVDGNTELHHGLFWRFWAIDDSDVDVVIIRDTDSRFSIREKTAVYEWLNSPNILHIMRDSQEHSTHILGGMWGMKRCELFGNMKKLISLFYQHNNNFINISNFRGIDQIFLSMCVYGRYTTTVHDPYFEGKPFPTNDLEPKHHVGACYFPDRNDYWEYTPQLRK